MTFIPYPSYNKTERNCNDACDDELALDFNHIRHSRNNKFNKTTYSLLVIMGLIGSLAVGLGAYGAHILNPNKDIDEYRKHVYEIANKYQFYHTLALGLVPLAHKPQISGLLFLLGMILFCGSNYYYALSGDLRFIMLTPTGGVTLAVAWLSLLIPI